MLKLGQNSAARLQEERAAQERRTRLNNMAMARESMNALTFEQALNVFAQFIEMHAEPDPRSLRCFAQTMDRHADELERRS